MTQTHFSSNLVGAMAALNERQREAVLHDGHVVVLAGPGSGKTRVLTVRTARLLATLVPRRSSLAALTYTNAAADEMQERLDHMGIPQSRRVVIGTAHSFCLHEILLTHQDILPTRLPEPLQILSARAASRLASTVLDERQMQDGVGAELILTRVRRVIATHGSLDPADESFRDASLAYADALQESGALDFEEVTIRALEALQDPTILRLVANRFTHLLVDEYQDLGPVLHTIVMELLRAGVEITAVGDPDQSIMGFTGATPEFLLELCDSPDFATIQLDMNYRSAASIVAAASRLVASKERPQQHVRDVMGVIQHIQVSGDQWSHAVETVALVRQKLDHGVRPGEIALLYARKGAFLTALLTELSRAGVPYFHDRAEIVPRGPLARWISRCALRVMRLDSPGATLPVDLTIPKLVYDLGRLSQSRTRSFLRRIGRQLAEFFASDVSPEESTGHFTIALADALGLRQLVSTLAEETDRDDFHQLLELEDVPISILASSISPTAVTVTTYQSAKGREFDVVIMPGLVEGNVPYWKTTGPPAWEREPPKEEEISEERRSFYVAVTRARNELYLITGSGWTNKGGYWELPEEGPSRYVQELMEYVD